MANDKLFKYAGTAVKKGQCHVRFGNSPTRGKELAKDGQSDIRLIELPEPMTKMDAVSYLIKLELFSDTTSQLIMGDYLGERVAVPVKSVPVKSVPVKSVPVSEIVESILEMEPDLDDMPF